MYRLTITFDEKDNLQTVYSANTAELETILCAMTLYKEVPGITSVNDAMNYFINVRNGACQDCPCWKHCPLCKLNE